MICHCEPVEDRRGNPRSVARLLEATVAISGLFLGLRSLFKAEAQSEAKGKRGTSLLAMTG